MKRFLVALLMSVCFFVMPVMAEDGDDPGDYGDFGGDIGDFTDDTGDYSPGDEMSDHESGGGDFGAGPSGEDDPEGEN